MPNEFDPIVGQWYQRRDKGEMFRVVAADSGTGCTEIQYFAMSPQDWCLSLESIRTAEEPWQDARAPDELEEEEEGRPIESYVEEEETLSEGAS